MRKLINTFNKNNRRCTCQISDTNLPAEKGSTPQVFIFFTGADVCPIINVAKGRSRLELDHLERRSLQKQRSIFDGEDFGRLVKYDPCHTDMMMGNPLPPEIKATVFVVFNNQFHQKKPGSSCCCCCCCCCRYLLWLVVLPSLLYNLDC